MRFPAAVNTIELSDQHTAVASAAISPRYGISQLFPLIIGYTLPPLHLAAGIRINTVHTLHVRFPPYNFSSKLIEWKFHFGRR
jgi:hypothetical protein